MVKAVLFDLDGTLVNSLLDLSFSTNYALKKMGFPTHETEAFKYFVGDGMLKLIERAVPEDKRDTDTVNKTLGIFMEHYRVHYVDKTVAYKGIPELLDLLSENGFKTAVISNKAQEMAVTVTNKILGEKFSVVCGKQENYPTKPDPALTLKVISELGVKPEECVFIGDSGMDMALAENIGCVSIGVLWGFRREDELRQNGADYIVTAPKEIFNVIKEINNG